MGAEDACEYPTDPRSAEDLGVSSGLCCLLHLLPIFTSSSYLGCCKDTLEVWSECVRVTEWFGLEKTFRAYLVQSLCCEVSLDQVAQSADLEHFQ